MNSSSQPRSSSLAAPLLAAELPVEGEGASRLLTLSLQRMTRLPVGPATEALTFHTDAGDFQARYHAPRHVTPFPRAVVYLTGANGGLEGPAHGVFSELCTRLQARDLAGLRIDYRHPNELPECILDALLAVQFLQAEGVDRVALVGYSFGGPVAISAGALSTEVTAVVALSTQTYGADLVSQVSPRPLLVVHGGNDQILSPVCSELVHAAARQPKQLKIFPDAGHGLDGVRDELATLLETWLLEHT